jgi:hypothetical protein
MAGRLDDHEQLRSAWRRYRASSSSRVFIACFALYRSSWDEMATIFEFVVWEPSPFLPFAIIGYIVGGVVLAALLFNLRGLAPFWYGCLEVAVGIVVLIFTLIPTSHPLLVQAPTFIESTGARVIASMAGLYIIVRGLDNMERDLPISWRSVWDRLFPKQKRKRDG